jgi:hypothetical protein
MISRPAQSTAFRSVIIDCENNGIHIHAMGVEIAPAHLGNTEPIRSRQRPCSCSGVAGHSSSSPIPSHQISYKLEKDRFVEIQARLCTDGADCYTVFSLTIHKQSISMAVFNAVGDT